MTGDCTLADCGAAAVGQCHHCGREFCAAHRFVSPGGAAARHLCAECAAVEAEARAYSCAGREASLAAIRATVHALLSEGFFPPDPFIWTHRVASRWWAFGGFGRYRVAIPAKRGWLVGDYPWGGMVNHGPGASTNEVFLRPTFVDGQGRLAPRDAIRSTMMDDELFTDQMCHEIAETMAEIADATRENARTAHDNSP